MTHNGLFLASGVGDITNGWTAVNISMSLFLGFFSSEKNSKNRLRTDNLQIETIPEIKADIWINLF